MKNVLANFKIDGEFVSCVPYGEGHINDTYLVTFKNDPIGLYILQRINHNIFKDVKGLMNNGGKSSRQHSGLIFFSLLSFSQKVYSKIY